MLRKGKEKKKIPFKILLLIYNVYGHPKDLMKIDNEINVVSTSGNKTFILSPWIKKQF